MSRAPEGLGIRLYRLLAWLTLPADFRRERGEELVQVVRQSLSDPSTADRRFGRLGLWLRESIGLFGLAWRLRRLRRGVGRTELPATHHVSAPTPRSGATPVPSVVLSEFRFALRRIAAHPGASFLIVATLALGIGANTAVFSVLNGAILDPLAYAHPGRTVSVTEQRTSDGVTAGLS